MPDVIVIVCLALGILLPWVVVAGSAVFARSRPRKEMTTVQVVISILLWSLSVAFFALFAAYGDRRYMMPPENNYAIYWIIGIIFAVASFFYLLWAVLFPANEEQEEAPIEV